MSLPDRPSLSRRAALRTLTLGAAGAALVPARLFAAAATPPMTVYKDAACPCCDPWAAHLRAAGWTVDVRTEPSGVALDRHKDALGLPVAVRSCHTGVLSLPAASGRPARRYLIEGHVPAAALARLLRERPDVAGLAVPGMVSGTPGMDLPPGAPAAPPYGVVAFAANGATRPYGEYPSVYRTARS